MVSDDHLEWCVKVSPVDAEVGTTIDISLKIQKWPISIEKGPQHH